MRPHLERSGLSIPQGEGVTVSRQHHSEDLLYLLTEMQSTAREYAGAKVW